MRSCGSKVYDLFFFHLSNELSFVSNLSDINVCENIVLVEVQIACLVQIVGQIENIGGQAVKLDIELQILVIDNYFE
jgi:hypothetical protein